jgi:DNA-binding transcriptional ArsR family regulator
MRVHGAPLSASELAAATGLTRYSANYQLRTLAAAGLVDIVERQSNSLVRHRYALVDSRATLVDSTTQLLALAGALTVPGRDGYPRPTEIDPSAQTQLDDLYREVVARVSDIAAASTKRARGTSTAGLSAA